MRIACVGGLPPRLLADLADLAEAPPQLFSSADGALRLPRDAQPDVWVTEVFLPGVSGFEFARRVSARASAAPVMVVTRLAAVWPLARAVRAGARGYLPLPVAPERLSLALHRLLDGGAFRTVPESVGADLQLQQAGVLDLPPRRFEALHLLLQGADATGTALAMSISPRSAADYRRGLRRDLSLAGAPDLQRLAGLLGAGFYGPCQSPSD